MSPRVRESGFRNPGIFCLWNPESHQRLESRIRVLLTNTGIQYLESGIRSPESKTVLDSLTCALHVYLAFHADPQ